MLDDGRRGIVGQAHAVDRGQRRRRLHLPGGADQVPLVGPSRAELGQELVERGNERGHLGPGRPRLAEPPIDVADACIEQLGQLGRPSHHPGQLPHRVHRQGRVHAADAGDQAHRPFGPADAGADLAQDPRPDGRGDGLVAVLVREATQERAQGEGPTEERFVRDGREVRTVGAHEQRLLAVRLQLVLRHLAGDPAEPASHRLGRAGVLVPVLFDIGRDVRVVAEVGLVDAGRRHPRGAARPHPEEASSEIGVAAEDAERLVAFPAELVLLHAEALEVEISPAGEARPFPAQVPPQRRERLGEDLVHVRPRPESVPGTHDVVCDPSHAALPSATDAEVLEAPIVADPTTGFRRRQVRCDRQPPSRG